MASDAYIACFCHEVIHPECCLVDEFDCEKVYGQ